MLQDADAQPIVPRPPSTSRVASTESKRVGDKISANRRALAILLRQVENGASSAADASDDSGMNRAPRRVNRTRGFLKDIQNVTNVGDLLDREHQYRCVIDSNETRQRALIQTHKYAAVVIAEEQSVVIEAENRARASIERVESRAHQASLSSLHIICEEFVVRLRLQQSYPPAPVVDAFVLIMLRLVRQDERSLRVSVIEATEELVRLQLFRMYLIESEFWQERPAIVAAVHQRMRAERIWLELQQEQRATQEMQEYVARDALESSVHSQLMALIGQSHRDLRCLEHNDVQKVEARRRAAMGRTEDAEYYAIVTECVRERRALMGNLSASRLGMDETRGRNEIETEASGQMRVLRTACLRDWHSVHLNTLRLTDIFQSVVASEQLRRVDMEADYRSSFQALILHDARERHCFIAHRDWERRHLKETYLDGRAALWQQQDLLVDDMFQRYQRGKHMLGVTSLSVLLDKEEEAKRNVIVMEQWKVFMLFYLWSAVQRCKVLAVTGRQELVQREEECRMHLVNLFVTEKTSMESGPVYSLLEREDSARSAVGDDELDARIYLHTHFRQGCRDTTKAILEVGTLLVTSSEATARKQAVQQEQYDRFTIQGMSLQSVAIVEKRSSMVRQETLERKLIYARILAFVADLFRVDITFEEEQARVDVEHHKLFDEELNFRIALHRAEEDRLALLRKMYESKDLKTVGLIRDEMELRVALLAEAEVHTNALATRFVCYYPSSPRPVPLFFVSYQNDDLLRLLRQYDSRSFLEDLLREMTVVRSIDEPAQRRWIVTSELVCRSRAILLHHETLIRNVIVQQEEREMQASLETIYRVHQRDVAFVTAPLQREAHNAEADARIHHDVDERADMLKMLEVQEELYHLAEEHIKFRMLLDEGPLLREYYRIHEEIVAGEELQRDTIATLATTDRAVARAMKSVGGGHQEAVVATTPPPSALSEPIQQPLPEEIAQCVLDASPPPKMQTPRRLQPYDLVLHSVQLSVLSKMLQAPKVVVGDLPATSQGSSKPTLLVKLAIDGGVPTLVAAEEAQRISIGSKTLMVLQPTLPQATTWRIGGEGVHAVVQVFLHGVPAAAGRVGATDTVLLLSGVLDVTMEDCEDPDKGILSVSLLANDNGTASGKATFLVNLQ